MISEGRKEKDDVNIIPCIVCVFIAKRGPLESCLKFENHHHVMILRFMLFFFYLQHVM